MAPPSPITPHMARGHSPHPRSHPRPHTTSPVHSPAGASRYICTLHQRVQSERAPVEPGERRTPVEYAFAGREGRPIAKALLILCEQVLGHSLLHLQLGCTHRQLLAVLLRGQLGSERRNLAAQFGNRRLVSRLLLIELGCCIGRLEGCTDLVLLLVLAVSPPALVGLPRSRVDPLRLELFVLKPPERESAAWEMERVGVGRARCGLGVGEARERLQWASGPPLPAWQPSWQPCQAGGS